MSNILKFDTITNYIKYQYLALGDLVIVAGLILNTAGRAHTGVPLELDDLVG